ncbi:MAG: hypothetical protein KAR19_14835 [Bacteroidales bacterium]|nr:hypothetical protein [Bacteroidales bacterium]
MKKKIRFSLIAFCLLLSPIVYSQENNGDLKKILERKNSVDLTIGGTGLFLSVNYSRILAVKSNYFINTSVGIGTVPFIGGISLPHQVTFNLGKKSSFLELGIGGNFWSGKSNSSGYTETINSYHISPIIGWRKNFKNNLVFRAYANPLIYLSGEHFLENLSVTPFLGVSLGYAF